MEVKGAGIREMFSSIAPRYDLLNRVLSLGQDQQWRRLAVKKIPLLERGIILDVATGTGDIALTLAHYQPPATSIIGMDFSGPMLDIARRKISKRGLNGRIKLVLADALSLPLADETVDAAIIAFGLRNLVHATQGLSEFYRVIKPGGYLVILEFGFPANPVFQRLYHFYFLRILPWIGGLISRNHRAYRYLPESVLAFPYADALEERLWEAGFQEAEHHKLTGGIALVYRARRP